MPNFTGDLLGFAKQHHDIAVVTHKKDSYFFYMKRKKAPIDKAELKKLCGNQKVIIREIPHKKLFSLKHSDGILDIFEGDTILYDSAELVSRAAALSSLREELYSNFKKYISGYYFAPQERKFCVILKKKLSSLSSQTFNKIILDMQHCLRLALPSRAEEIGEFKDFSLYIGFKAPTKLLIPIDKRSSTNVELLGNKTPLGALTGKAAIASTACIIAMMAPSDGFAYNMLTDYGVSSESSSQEKLEIINTSGDNVPLPYAMSKLVPSSYRYAFDNTDSMRKRVSWTAGQDWQTTLSEALEEQGLELNISNGVVSISNAASSLPMTPMTNTTATSPTDFVLKKTTGRHVELLPTLNTSEDSPTLPNEQQGEQCWQGIREETLAAQDIERKETLTGYVGMDGGSSTEGKVIEGQALANVKLIDKYAIQVEGLASDNEGQTMSSLKGHIYYRSDRGDLLGVTSEWETVEDNRRLAFGVETEIQLREQARGYAEVGYEDIDYEMPNTTEYHLKPDDVKGAYATVGVMFFPAENVSLDIAETATAEEFYTQCRMEWQSPFAISDRLSLFSDGTAGSDGSGLILSGMRYHFGREKTLIERHKEDYVIHKGPRFMANEYINLPKTSDYGSSGSSVPLP